MGIVAEDSEVSLSESGLDGALILRSGIIRLLGRASKGNEETQTLCLFTSA